MGTQTQSSSTGSSGSSAIAGWLLRQIAKGRILILFFFHGLVFAACCLFAYQVRFDFAIPPESLATFRTSLPIVVLVQLLVGSIFGFYRGWWRYVGMAEVIRLVVGLTAALAILLAAWYAGPMLGLKHHFISAPRGVLLIDWAFALLTLFGARVIVRVGHDRLRKDTGATTTVKRVLILGAGDAGETLAREIEHRPQLGMKVAGFIDDHHAKRGSRIRGIEVFGPISEVAAIVDRVSAEEALIAIPSASGKRMREIINHLSAADLQFKTIPGIDQLMSGKVHVTQLRPVNVEDLLRRERIDLPGDPVRALFRDKRVLITGAGGTIGSELASQVQQFEPASVALVERSEYALYSVNKRLTQEAGWIKAEITCNLVDVCDNDIVEDLLGREQPEIVLHAAAHKHVPLGEQNPPEYVRNNALASRRLGQLCEAAGVKRFVLISTDKAINPTSVMGASKRAAEIMLRDIARRGAMKVTAVRFGNVIGSSGSVIPLFMEQIASGGPVTVTHPEVTRYFLRTSEAVSLVLQAATLGNGGDVFMLDMGEPVKIADLARDLIRLSNHTDAEVPIAFTGLRPGEKLFEELRMHDESVRPTVHPQIVITAAPQPDAAAVARWVARLQAACEMGEGAVIPVLREVIPEYTPAVMHARSESGRHFPAAGVIALVKEPKSAPAS